MITLQFVTTGDALDKVIETVTHGWPSHVDFIWSETGADNLLGAQLGSGVMIRPSNYETVTRAERVTLPTTPEQEASIRSFLYAQLGLPYDWLAVAAFAVGASWRLPNHWFCSELIDRPLQECKLLTTRPTPSKCAPVTLFNDCLKVPGVKTEDGSMN
jgi:hypothetical protein